jgi:tetratricopeptide (TPR) repeat protein
MPGRQWSKAAWGLALVFGSLPLVGRVVLGDWEFVGAGEIAVLLAGLGIYLHIRSRRYHSKPDLAVLLEQAGKLAADGRTDRAIALLTKTARQSPRLWQAYQYRGELRLRIGEFELAAQDFAQAIRMAPDEPHLHVLLEQAEKTLDAGRHIL